MKLWPIFVCLLALGAYTLGQDHRAAQSSGRAEIQGIVTKDPSSEPVNKVLVELIAENQREGGNYTATTDVHGSFRIDNIQPGRYRLFAERTNDLGEFRIANLASGNVYVSVNPPPDFSSLIEAGGAATNSAAADKPATSYQTTYYPGTTDRSQATPIQLRPGDEFPLNFSLTPSPSLSIRGQVVNLPPRTSATIMLQSRDSRLVTSGTEIYKDGSFVIRDVSPGSYTVLATVDGGAVPMMARQTLEVASSNVDGLRLLPQPGGSIRGRLRVESNGRRFDPNQIYLVLEPADGDDEELAVPGEKFSNLAHVTADGEFVWTDVPPGTYRVQMAGNSSGANEDWFVKSTLVGGRDVNDSGLIVNGGTVILDLVVSANGAVIEGVVADSQGQPVANAVVVAVPEIGMRGNVGRYRETVSDQAGHFSLRGIRAGSYTLFAWESVDGQAYYNPEFLKSYEGQGSALRVDEGERKAMQLTVIPVSDEQP
jgi:hypothetical protein